MTTEPADLADCDVVVEAIVEDRAAKGELIARLASGAPAADLATTTSSLHIGELADAAASASASSASTSSTRRRGWS